MKKSKTKSENVVKVRHEDANVKTKSHQRSLIMSEKLFQNRDSLLTEMFKIPHVNAIFNMFLAFIVLMLLKTLMSDWVDKGILNHLHHLWWVSNEFGKPQLVIATLLVLYSICLLIFGCWKLWIYLRLRMTRFFVLLDVVFVLLYLILFSLIIYVPIHVAIYIVLPPCSASFVVYEQVRLVMKLHAYTRSIVPKVIREIECNRKNQKTPKRICEIISIKQYSYYMIAPTLVYRETYPMRTVVSYRLVCSHAIQFVLCITFMYNIFIVLMRDNFKDFNPSFWTPEVLYKKFFQSILPTILMMLTMFYTFLHTWLNLFAEWTKFGDRLFYDDWWNATSLSDYYRTWNVLVHDWLYNYVYKDIVFALYFLTKNKRISKVLGSVGVFFVSALVHEYILAYCFRFFYPVLLLVFFTFGTSLYFVKATRTSRISNVLLWICLFLGNSIFLTLYSFEWYARTNCQRTVDGYKDYIIPRSLVCIPI